MRRCLAIIPLLVLAVHALLGQSGVVVCLGGSQGHETLVAAAEGGGACSHAGDLLVPATADPLGNWQQSDGHADPVRHDDHDDECSCSDLLIGLRDEVTVPRVRDDSVVWAAAPVVVSTWPCDGWSLIASARHRPRGRLQSPGDACSLAIVRSTRLLS